MLMELQLQVKPPLIDTHAHLADARLADRLNEVLRAASDRGVARILAIGTTAADSQSVVQIAGTYPGVFATVGIQPNHVAEAAAGDWASIERLAREPNVVALGETGLDRYWDYTPFDQQQAMFDRHLELARALDKPVVIHCRDCEADIVAQLERARPPVRGVLHSFTGTWDDAQAFLALGLHISFAGMITFPTKKLDALRDAAARIPLDRVLVETDSPYLAPQSVRGKTNEPGHVAETAAFVAKLRDLSVEDFAAATTANARALFRLPEFEVAASARSK